MMNLIGPLLMEKENGQASALAAKALKLRPDKPLVLQKAEALLKEFLEAGDNEAVTTLLSGWTEARPQDKDAWHNLGLMSLGDGAHDQAIQCFERVHELAPRDDFAVVQLAKLYFQRKQARQCISHCDELLKRGHEAVLAIGLKARVLNFAGGYEQALAFLQPYLDHNPNNDTLFVVLSELHEYRDNYDLAVEALQRAKRLLEADTSKHRMDNLQVVNQKLQRLAGMR
jgi:tetratricopeptide (TPR) repeat protein